jgi:hypothetical protein
MAGVSLASGRPGTAGFREAVDQSRRCAVDRPLPCEPFLWKCGPIRVVFRRCCWPWRSAPATPGFAPAGNPQPRPVSRAARTTTHVRCTRPTHTVPGYSRVAHSRRPTPAAPPRNSNSLLHLARPASLCLRTRWSIHGFSLPQRSPLSFSLIGGESTHQLLAPPSRNTSSSRSSSSSCTQSWCLLGFDPGKCPCVCDGRRSRFGLSSHPGD